MKLESLKLKRTFRKISFVIPAPLPDRTPSFAPLPIGLTQEKGESVKKVTWPRTCFLSLTTKSAVGDTNNNGVVAGTKIAAGDTNNNGVVAETKIAAGDTKNNGVGAETKDAIGDTNNQQ